MSHTYATRKAYDWHECTFPILFFGRYKMVCVDTEEEFKSHVED
jgi:hypothetical protein